MKAVEANWKTKRYEQVKSKYPIYNGHRRSGPRLGVLADHVLGGYRHNGLFRYKYEK